MILKDKIKSLMYSKVSEDRQLAVEYMRHLTELQILYLLPDTYRHRGWKWRQDQKNVSYSQEYAYYYDLGFGELGYNGFIWYCAKNSNEPMSKIPSYKLKY